MWGQVISEFSLVDIAGIIPTRVGTSTDESLCCFRSRDHPHACGDKNTIVLIDEIGTGSSPRMWGQGASMYRITCFFRIIHTRVGTRYRFNATSEAFEDHPHACGDKTEAFDMFIDEQGSSPCVWGQAR